jgi:hypothetical protein
MELRTEAYYVSVHESKSAAIERILKRLTVFVKDQQEALRRCQQPLADASRAPRFRRVAG